MSRRKFFEAVVKDTVYAVIHAEYVFIYLLHIFLYIFFINIGCVTLYYLSMMYVTVYNMSINSNSYFVRGAKLQVYPNLEKIYTSSYRSFNF